MVHFTNSLNKPHEWSEYKNYTWLNKSKSLKSFRILLL
jgi:hypothetical protein